MDMQSTIKLLNDTFSSNFDLNRFIRFVKELFNNFYVNQRDCTKYIAKEYKDYISSFEKIGDYENARKSMEVLVVQLNKTSSRDRARTMQRNFIANWLGKTEKEAALVAFYGDDPQDWRFSFVKMEYDLIKDKSGKVKPVKELTPAKRYSFLVGANEPNHTCSSQFKDLVMKEDINPSLEEIEQAFSIDNVTKEFFLEYKELFLKLEESLQKVIKKDKHVKEEFEVKNISTVDFAKKVLGQIVFIYFLQKKGWLGVQKDESGRFKDWGTGTKKFLRKLFDKDMVPYDNFFNEILEPLFYEALATERDDDYYSRFKCKIPFLNGGLFEPINDYDWTGTKIVLDNSIFEKIFNTFDRFNFTVKEDEPLDREVAIDPEMLGKVFENLLEIKDRKSTGRYYTPREIVHYMCQQSLINYLETNTSIPRKDIEKFIQFGEFATSNDSRILEDIKVKQDKLKKGIINAEIFQNEVKQELDKLDLPKTIIQKKEKIDELLREIKIVDPAVGSGAFPVGMLNEIVKGRVTLSTFFEKKKSDYELKREIIKNCLYGVDIDSSAVDIAKLRFWLSLIVDETDMKNIKPLPNLDHKIMCGNSLLEEFEGKKLFDENLLGEVKKDNSFEVKQINKEIAQLYKEKGEVVRGKLNSKTSKQIDKEIKKLKKKKQDILSGPEKSARDMTLDEAMQKRIKESQKKLDELKKLQNQFFNEQNRNKKKQLRANIDKLEWELIEETLKEQGNLEAMQKLEQYKRNKSKPFFLWKLYFAEVFRRENPGFDVVIANPPYVGQKGNNQIFRPIKESALGIFHQRRMDYFYFFFHQAINISRVNGSISFITTNYYITATYADILRKDFKQRTTITEFVNFNELGIFETAKGQHNLITFLIKGVKNIPLKIISTNRKGHADSNTLNRILYGKDLITNYFEIPTQNFYDGPSNYIRLYNKDSNKLNIESILDKVKQNGKLLSECSNITQGIVTGADKLSESHIRKYHIVGNKGDGIFVLSKQELTNLNLSSSEKVFLKPWFKDSDIKKWTTNIISKDFLIYYTSKANIEIGKNLLAHFEKYKPLLINRNTRSGTPIITSSLYDKFVKGAYDISYVMVASAFQRGEYYCVSYARDTGIEYFEIPKIVAPQRSKKNTFGYNESSWYASADVYYIVEKSKSLKLKYILALLNSKLYYLWLYFRGKRKGEMLELYLTPLSEIPIKEISKEQQKPFIELVDKILSITKNKDYLDNPDKQAKVKRLEKEIDQLVYKLYELTPKEIEIVEGFNK